jgi:glutamate racemase
MDAVSLIDLASNGQDAVVPSTAPLPGRQPPRVGVFDSGVGGLSVLRSLRSLMPGAELTYVADSGHGPYGERPDAYIVDRSERIARVLISDFDAGLLVVACNTATAAAVQRLRELWPSLPIVGVEPGLKPAIAASRAHRIGVLATPSTLESGKFQRLLEKHATGVSVTLQPCPGLAGLIEEGLLDSAPLAAMVERFCAPLRAADVDVVVLGCTHYAFVRHLIAAALGEAVLIVDTADAVARHAAHLAGSGVATIERSPSAVTLVTTGDAARARAVARAWLTFDCNVEARVI